MPKQEILNLFHVQKHDSVPEWSAFLYGDAKLMHCSLGNDIFLLLLPEKPSCMKGIKWHEALCLAGDRNQWLGSMLVVSLYMLPH